MTSEPLKKPRRWWRWPVRGVVGLVVLIALAVLSLWLRLLWEQRQGRAELAAVIAELDESDPRWRWEEIEADLPTIPDEENSVLRVKQVIDSFGQWKPGEMKLPDGTLVIEARHLRGNRRLDEQRLAMLRDDMRQHEKSIELALSLEDFPRGRASIQLTDDIVGTLLPHAQQTRDVAYLLSLDSERLLHDREIEKTTQRVRAILRTGASLRHDPFLISALVRVALRAIAVGRIERSLALGVLSDESCRSLIAWLEEERKEELLLPALRGERAGMNRLYENLETGKASLARLDGSRSEPDLLERLGSHAYSYRLPEDRACYLRNFQRLCENARLPDEKQMEGWEDFENELKESATAARSSKRRIIAHLILPAVSKVSHSALRTKAVMSCAITALACERFRLKQQRWPKTLDELVPAFVDKVPTDPFVGQPLRLAVREDGLVIYSVGGDRIDDGGEIDPPIGGGTSLDWGFRLYDADKRNLPPEPPNVPKDDEP